MNNKNILNIPKNIASRQPVVFFDEECNICNRSVQFLLLHNRLNNLSFASLQSSIAIEVLLLEGRPLAKNNTLLFIQDNKLYKYSTAALKISAHLDFPWNLIRVFIFIPTGVRDAIYRVISNNRYKWFGGKSSCLIADNSNLHRFIP